MDGTHSAERRQSERANCVLKVSYCPGGRKVRATETKNISDGGVLLMVSGDVKKNDLLDIKIPLEPGEDPIAARGRVVHIRTNGAPSAAESLMAGVAFLKLGEVEQEAIGRKVWQQILKEATRFGKIN